jgi:hypothetical protein
MEDAEHAVEAAIDLLNALMVQGLGNNKGLREREGTGKRVAAPGGKP